jgi:hypothetical protein
MVSPGSLLMGRFAARVQKVRPAFGGLVQRVHKVQKVQRVVVAASPQFYSQPPKAAYNMAPKGAVPRQRSDTI